MQRVTRPTKSHNLVYSGGKRLIDPGSRSGKRFNMDTVIIFDFDQTLIDCNSDPWVVNQLGAAESMNSLLRTNLSWTSLMERMMGELHAAGKNVSDIQNSLRTIPLHPEMIRAIKSAQARG